MIKDLGEVRLPLLIFGGIYSNLPALKRLRAIAEQQKIPPYHIICTGDIVSYCSQPEECVQFIRDWKIHSIAGNVEIQLREECTDCGCNFNPGSRCDSFSKVWYPFAQNQLRSQSIEWMKTLPKFITFRLVDKAFWVVHGAYTAVSQFIFKSTPWAIKKNSSAKQKPRSYLPVIVDYLFTMFIMEKPGSMQGS